MSIRPGFRNIVLAVVVLNLLAGVPAAASSAGADDAAVSDAASDMARLTPSLPGADYLLGLADHGGVEQYLQQALVAQLESQGLLPIGTVPRLAGDVPGGADADGLAAASTRPLPPGLNFLDARPACDMDGDGIEDVLGHEMALMNPPFDRSGSARLKAISGADASILWKRDPMFYTQLVLPSGISYVRYGDALPRGPQNMADAADLDGDGVCDFIGIDLAVTGRFSVPFSGASVTEFETRVHGITGATGEDLWVFRVAGSITQYQSLFGIVTAMNVQEFPTGFLAYDSPSGTKLVLKTTDINFQRVEDAFEITADTPTFEHPFEFADTYSGDHVRLVDAKTGTLRWTRDVDANADPDSIIVGFLTGVADVAGDAEPEIILDQLTLTNPRSSEERNPITGEKIHRYAKGMRMMALAGEVDGSGATVWETVILDHLAARPNPPVEEPYEQLVWVHGQILDDIDGDGRPDPMALYLAIEENMDGTVNGRFRTHFVPLSGANGTKIWDVRQQGWGFAESLAVDDGAPALVGIGLLDLPTPPPRGGRFPPKFVRLAVLDATDGGTMWSYERTFSQNSFVSYSMSLSQFQDSLAPFDWDGDGVKDLITPAQYQAPTGRNQVLLAMSSHNYEVKSGADGSVIRSLDAWGPDGRVVACEGAEPFVTTFGGHSRRFDLTRFDIVSGEQVWRRPVYNDPAPRAATSSIDITALGARCADDAAGRTLFSFNMQAFSFDRRNEVVNGFGFVTPEGTTLWQAPELRGNPPTTLIFEPYSNDAGTETTLVDTLLALGIALALGIGAGVATLAILSRRGAAAAILGFGFTAVLLSSAAAPFLGHAEAIGVPAVADVIDPALATATSLAGLADVPLIRGPAGPMGDSAFAPGIAPQGTRQEPSANGPEVAADSTHPDGLIRGGPLQTLVTGLAGDGEGVAPMKHMALVADYYRTLGYNVPEAGVVAHILAGGETKDRFEENLTLSYTYDIGDVDGDGVDDIALDEYCLDYDGCASGTNRIGTDWATVQVNGRVYGAPHHLWAVSGADGTVIWNRSLDVPVRFSSSGLTFVLGTAPTANGTGILTYEYTATGIIDRTFTHRIQLVDANTGLALWTFDDVGAYATPDLLFSATAENLVIHPIIQNPGKNGVPPLPAGTEAAIFLQGVGYTSHSYNTLFDGIPPGFNHPPTVTNAYHAKEWAAKVDVDTGAIEWRRDTFLPNPRLSVFPVVLDAPEFRITAALPANVEGIYWGAQQCCFDLTGDGIPDLLYKVYEWSPYPASNVEGPYDVDARMVLFDGATGEPGFDVQVLDDGGFNYRITFEPLGDADGDGIADFLLHEETFAFQYMHRVSARSGLDGSELWSMDNPRDFALFVLGDADDDGGNDVVMIDWYGYELANRMAEDLVTPQKLPVTLLSGATGERIWRTYTYIAPSDALHNLKMMRLNGLPDFDRDGVGDIVIDEPLYLGDQTVIHQQRIISGRDASVLYSVESVGAFAVPSRAPDVTGDDIDDLVIASGDLNDLWVTTYDGATGESLWSRRLLALPTSNSASAFPNLRFHAIGDVSRDNGDLLVNFHLYVSSANRVVFATGDGAREEFYVYTTLTPQILRFAGGDGRLEWAFPRVDEPALLAVVAGQTPGTQTYHEVLSTLANAPVQEVKTAFLSKVPVVGAFVLGYVGLILGAFATTRIGARIRRTRQEVPDLD